MEKIIRNAIRCNHCGDGIKSAYRRHDVQCSCGKVTADSDTDDLHHAYSGKAKQRFFTFPALWCNLCIIKQTPH